MLGRMIVQKNNKIPQLIDKCNLLLCYRNNVLSNNNTNNNANTIQIVSKRGYGSLSSLSLLNNIKQQQTISTTTTSNNIRWYSNTTTTLQEQVSITFLQPDGITEKIVQANVGESLLRVAHRNDIDLEGACEGVCACSTCHVIIPTDMYNTLPEPSEDEEDMLDMAFGLTETSRLGCQIIVTSSMDNTIIHMPAATRNFYVDGHVPKPH